MIPKQIAIIGAGPAGVMAAAQLVTIPNVTVYLFDKSKPLQTLLATGGGRCNLSHQESDPKILSSYYPRGGKFLLSVWQRFCVKDTLDFFHNLGLHTYVQPDQRIFPCSNQATEVRHKLLQAVASAHFIQAEVVDLQFIRGKFQITAVSSSYSTIQTHYKQVTAQNYRPIHDSSIINGQIHPSDTHHISETFTTTTATTPVHAVDNSRSQIHNLNIQEFSQHNLVKSNAGKACQQCYKLSDSSHHDPVTSKQATASQKHSSDLVSTTSTVLTTTSFQADYVIIASGGNRLKPQHSGYTLAAGLGHHITPLRPSLCALVTAPAYPELAGISLTAIIATVSWQGKQQFTVKGDMVFTHHGISGPLAYQISAYAAYIDFSPKDPLELSIDWLGSQTDLLMTKFQQEPSKKTLTSIAELLPKRLVSSLLSSPQRHTVQVKNSQSRSAVTFNLQEQQVNSKLAISSGISCQSNLINLSELQDNGNLSRKLRQQLLQQLTHYPLAVIQRDQHGEIVTAGGVDLNQIQQQTMASKLNPQLYFAGEVIDADGLTGGFNLQLCWSTGFIAGNSIRKLLTQS